MDDDQILKTVQSMLGTNIKIVDREETSSIREEETLLINGIPVTLDGDDGDAVKTALMTGQVPPCELLNQILYRAGILRQPVHLETSLSVKSTTVKKEEVTIAKNGIILDERTNETKEDNYYSSHCNEIWEPVKTIRTTKKENIPVDVNNELLSKNSTSSFIKNSNSNGGIHKDSSSVLNSSSMSTFSNVLQSSPSVSSVTSSLTSEMSPSLLLTKNQSLCSSNASNNREASSYFSLGTDKNSSSSSSNDILIKNHQNQNSINNNNNNNSSKNILDPSTIANHNSSNSCNNNKKKYMNDPSLSCDSGHDDIFNSLSQTNVLQYTSTDNSISSSYDMISSSDETDFLKKSSNERCLPLKCDMPTIFGTVTSDQSPKDNANKRALPQTTTTSGISVAIRKSNHDKQTLSSNAYTDRDGGDIAEKENLATEENSLVYRDGNLISGPLDALIQHMVPTSDYYPDRSYIFAFLLSARLFIRPYKLLEKICQLCEEQQNFNCKLDTTITTKSNEKNSLEFESYNSSNSISGNSSSLNDTERMYDCDHHRYHKHKKENGDDDDDEQQECCKKLKKFAQHFIQLLAEWIDTFPYDFRDERLMQHVRLMSKKCICIDSNLRKDVSTMLQNLLHRLTILEKYEEFLQSILNDSSDCPTNPILLSSSGGTATENRILSGGGGGGISASTAITTATNHHNSSTHQGSTTYHGTGGTLGTILHTNSSSSTSNCLHSSTSNSTLSSIDISELCPSPTLLAHQLTHIELERLSHIGPEEFVQAFAKENPHLEQSFNDIKKTRNLESYIQWFNRLSYFVATEIVKHCKKKQRVRIVEYWIETARECFNIGNFNSLMAIIAGLNMSPISRLKKTWAKVQSAKFSVLEHQMDPSSNFNSYRSTLKAAMWRSAGATDERERIVIPFFSLLVKDLYFLNEGCSNKLENGHVNFEKFWQLAKQVTEFIAWKQVTCPFEKLPKVITFLYTNPILNENMLALASFECEPPENHEKDRYKCLKSEHQQQQQQQQHQQQFQQQ